MCRKVEDVETRVSCSFGRALSKRHEQDGFNVWDYEVDYAHLPCVPCPFLFASLLEYNYRTWFFLCLLALLFCQSVFPLILPLTSARSFACCFLCASAEHIVSCRRMLCECAFLHVLTACSVQVNDLMVVVMPYCWCLPEISEASNGVLPHSAISDSWCHRPSPIAVFATDRLQSTLAPVD